MKMRTLLQAACVSLCLFSTPLLAAGQAEQSLHPAIDLGMEIPINGVAQMHPASARLVPGTGRAVIVDAAAARLYMIENGQVEDSMRVIVGKPSAATPPMRSTLYYATLNPYWNVPVEMGRTLIARNVLDQGTSYLRDKGYEVVSEFSKSARIIDPETVDWQAVADGRQTIHVRQRPGPANSMGQVKFNIPDGDGIYLHDTPRKELFDQTDRYLSHGCIRLEDAGRLADWLLGRDVELGSGAPEQFVALPAGVPIVITYSGSSAPALASLR